MPPAFTEPVSVALSWAVAPALMLAADSVVPMLGDAWFTVSCSEVQVLVAPLLLASPE